MTKQTKQVEDLTTSTPSRPDPEVAEKAQRRRFSATYKERILAEVERCTEPGELGALLRREGLYSSHLSNWRRQREHAVAAQRRGRKGASAATSSARVVQLERENANLRHQLEQAQAIIDVQKKLSELLMPAVTESGRN